MILSEKSATFRDHALKFKRESLLSTERQSRFSLHQTAYYAHADGVVALLDAGHDPNEHDKHGYTPLLWAAFRGAMGNQVPVIQALIAAGADVNAITRAGDANVLMLAIEAQEDVIVRTLLEHEAEVDRAANEVTPLM